MSHCTFHGFECSVQRHIFANRNEKIVQGRRSSAAITRNDSADVRQDMSNAPSVSSAAPQKEKRTYSQTCSRTAVKYNAAGATNAAEGGTRWPVSRIRMLSLDSAMRSSSVSLRVEYASHLSRKSYRGREGGNTLAEMAQRNAGNRRDTS